ncbi:uncharacterized protein LOC126809497 [Patella vulgata]|uniref:uncharacterized protein LOC126809497 n=1 Tax=Patella vulgata TaxID=6465 RepID=UPI00217F575F|nr:uncharacterized protein LOC126809497 [Patella vulgata]
MKILTLLVILATTAKSNAFFFNSLSRNNWNGLKVKFGLNPFSNNFDALPRTEADAIKEDFTKISGCKDIDSFRGNRYVKDGDHAVVLLYDDQGNIAGIQAGVPDGQENKYPFDGVRPPFIHENGFNYMTAYFVDPSTVCSPDTSDKEYTEIGTNLYIQNGANPEKDSLLIPRDEAEIGNTKWTEGKCFYGMGKHYWYDLRTDTDCESYFPVFLLYNGGKLNGFGWAFTTNLTSPRYEHPKPSQFKSFMSEVPTCLYNVGPIATMHIYMTATPRLNFC